MGTTDARLAKAALEAMSDSGINYALLHGSEALETGRALSDLDTVVDRPPDQVIVTSLSAWERCDLRPVIVWPYDIGGTRTVFLVTSDASAGVQLDLLFDPKGEGKYRVRSHRLLEHVDRSHGGVPVLSEPARLVYLFQKRRRKAQSERVEDVLARARAIDGETLENVALDLTGSADIIPAMSGHVAPMPRRRVLPDVVRGAVRLRHPIGFWAHVSGPAIAAEAVNRFGAVLAATGSGPVPAALVRPSWYAFAVAPVRHRAGLFASWGSARGRWPAPDLVVEHSDTDVTIREIVSTMARRVISCVS